MIERIKTGKLYNHFKGHIYTVLDYPVYMATNGQEGEYVYYRCETGPNKGKRYLREANEFASEVDHDKYPLVTQKYRFELI